MGRCLKERLQKEEKLAALFWRASFVIFGMRRVPRVGY